MLLRMLDFYLKINPNVMAEKIDDNSVEKTETDGSAEPPKLPRQNYSLEGLAQRVKEIVKKVKERKQETEDPARPPKLPRQDSTLEGWEQRAKELMEKVAREGKKDKDEGEDS